ncbi:ABC transporter ATP-binding protein/permease [Aestuariirhabdus litorea]|uniref:ATP-binding cassette domain-containing protein n=1 Tax=Aestuariirhabdus litorea TaxID=2528527 RepID=A0A3P3VQ52_9GAMM|nr:ABC transporter ATP-binding protein/permease [Aestuariirhabdus litorea]RRJ84750.1 ATP-binding cassette domain-containing protein [Aestuariirhabdus litorea]RWW97975.1 ATP-binding cassette domain-containing protein [Endozoicomonadaceae bacterium GTF-13]
MDRSIYRYIIKNTLRDQVLILLLTLVAFPLVYASLDVPKQIINRALAGTDIPETVLGYELNQISYLFFLCSLFLLLVILNGALKYVLNVYRGVVGERMLRNLRLELYSRILRFPLPHFKRISQGEIIPIITAETEPLGGFIGDAFALPAFQGGLLLTYLFFIFNQDPLLGLAAISLYPLQMYVIPKLQRKVNALSKQRVLAARRLGDKVGDSMAGIQDVHTLGTSEFERVKIAARLQDIFLIRFDIYKRKFFIKFLNNFLSKVTPFFFYSIGGYYVIQGELTIGALVAVLAAYQDLDAPWKELLKYYQTKEDVRVKYEQIVEQFTPVPMFPPSRLNEGDTRLELVNEEIRFDRVFFSDPDASVKLDSITMTLAMKQSVGLMGDNESGASELAQLICKLQTPDRGAIQIFGHDLKRINEPALSRTLCFVGPRSHLFAGTIRENLLYGLTQPEGFSPSDLTIYEQPIGHDWLDLEQTPYDSLQALQAEILSLCTLFELDADLYRFGLQQSMANAPDEQLAHKLVTLRQELRDRLSEAGMDDLIETFDSERYNTNISVAENILFGSCSDPSLSADTLHLDGSLQRSLLNNQLMPTALSIGYKVAETMIELFADLEPGNDIYERFSFISAEDLPEYKELLAKHPIEKVESLQAEQREKLLALFMKLTPARHRLGLIDESIQATLVKVRQEFAQLQQGRRELVHYRFDQFNGLLSIQENILFGKLVYGKANAQQKVADVIDQLIDEHHLRADIQHYGLEYEVGTAGSKLQTATRQKLALIRAMIKQPRVMVVDQATSALDEQSEQRLIERLLTSGRCAFVWVVNRQHLMPLFEHRVELAGGRIIDSTPSN